METVHGNEKEVFRCPRCNVPAQHLLVAKSNYMESLKGIAGVPDNDWAVDHQHLIYKCTQCQQETYFLFRATGWLVSKTEGRGSIQPTTEVNEVLHQYPTSTASTHTSVPAPVKRSCVEASKCLSVAAFNACGVMLRRAIHDLCADKKAKGTDLYKQLKWLKDQGAITPDIWEWAEELRVLGRSGAHPEWEDVEPKEAEYGIRFLEEIVKYVYVNPYERNKMKLKETKAKK